LLPICSTVTSPWRYFLDVTEALILAVNAAFVLTLAGPVLHQTLALYEGSGEDSWGDGDTGIDLDVHSAAGDNVRDVLSAWFLLRWRWERV